MEFTRDINQNTPVKQLWDKVGAIRGNPLPITIKHLKLGNNTVIHQPMDIANALGQNWSEYSNDNNFSIDFCANKQKIQSQIVYHLTFLHVNAL